MEKNVYGVTHADVIRVQTARIKRAIQLMDGATPSIEESAMWAQFGAPEHLLTIKDATRILSQQLAAIVDGAEVPS